MFQSYILIEGEQEERKGKKRVLCIALRATQIIRLAMVYLYFLL